MPSGLACFQIRVVLQCDWKARSAYVIAVTGWQIMALRGAANCGAAVPKSALDAGVETHGCTVHFVDAVYDSGPIILQRACPVFDDDTAETLAARVFEQESTAYPEAIRLFQAGRLKVEGRRVTVLPDGAPRA